MIYLALCCLIGVSMHYIHNLCCFCSDSTAIIYNVIGIPGENNSDAAYVSYYKSFTSCIIHSIILRNTVRRISFVDLLISINTK